MSRAKQDPAVDPDTEWLDHVRPTGLVVSKAILKELGVTPLRQTALDSEAVKLLLAAEGSALVDPWAFFRDVLGWPASHVAGAPGGPALPESLRVSLPEQQTVLAPDWAVKVGEGERPQLLVQLLPAGVDPDRRGALDGWEASAHQRFERLLRETQVLAGILVSDSTLRLVYAPVAETSGWLSFPLRQLSTVAGRPMLAGLKLLLSSGSLFIAPENKRLPALLRQSREAQASVSQELAGQVLGALHELLRGLHAADRARIERLARESPAHLYEGLLTVLIRLVFLLYAEDRDLLPSRTDAESRDLYDRNYSVRLLLAQLADDEVQNPDTMDERVGAWGRLLALFRLVHTGDRSGWIVARGGKLFDPDAFPFLEGREFSFLPNEVGEVARRAGGVMPREADAPRVLPLSDGCVLRLLRGLMTLRGERLSYRTLDVEQIGSVYETVMGFTVQVAAGLSLAIRAGKNNRTPVFVDCANLAETSADTRQRDIKESAGRAQLPAKVATALKAAKDATEIALALTEIVDSRGSPDHAPSPVGTPILQPTDERRRTGSHYTPRSLTEPIVRQALAPALERLGANATPAQILDLKVCDPAMGSGAFLVEACRQLGERLVKAWAHPGPKPVVPADEDDELHARRLVAQRCLYGVDKNPMATDLGRLSLWLATLAREHEFTFLDHALKIGDSLVGLTRAQIAALHWEAGPGHAVMRYMVRDRFNEVLEGRNEIRSAPDDVSRAIQEQRHRQTEIAVQRLRNAGDAVISAFFSADKPRMKETRRAEIESWFAGGESDLWDRVDTIAAQLRQARPHPLRPFHWELEFPEVFDNSNPGFDAVVSNPPFLGGKRISTEFGDPYSFWLARNVQEASRSADIVAYFFQRAWDVIRRTGAFGLIATNTIGQGDTRETGLTSLLRSGGRIYSATRRLPWPGEAAVIVSVVHIGKQIDDRKPILDEKPVRRISAYLVEGDLDELPKLLPENTGKAFNGSYVLGMGFTFDNEGAGDGIGEPTSIVEMQRLIKVNSRNQECIFPFIGGEELNNDPEQKPHRYVINFFDRPLASVRSNYPDLIDIVERKVKPDRDLQKRDALRERWWQFADKRPGLVVAIERLQRVLAISQVTQYLAFAFLPTSYVYSHRLYVIADDRSGLFSTLQSSVHEIWARFFGSTLEDRFMYAVEDCFRTFPLPTDLDVDRLRGVGDAYYDHRAIVMKEGSYGLTKIYNRFHDANDNAQESVKLRLLHHEMDSAVLHSFGWDDLAARGRAQQLTAQIEDEPKYQNRLFWPADFRNEVLGRLLDLNARRAASAVVAGSAASKAGKRRRKQGFSESQVTLL